MIRHVGRTHCAKENRIALFELIETAFGDVIAVLLVVGGAPREMFDIQFEAAVAGGQHFQYFKACRNDLGADAIAGDGGYCIFTHEVFAGNQFVETA